MRLKRLLTTVAAATALVGAAGGVASALGSATLTPAYQLPSGYYKMTVTLSGFTPNQTVFFMTCNQDGNVDGAIFDPLYDCSAVKGINPSADASGGGTFDFETFVGLEEVNQLWSCETATPCFLRLAPGNSDATTSDVFVPFDLSGTPPTSSTTSTTEAPGTQVPEVPLNILLPLGAAAVVGGAVVITRRRAARA